MAVIGFNFTKIEGRIKSTRPKGDINVNSSPKIENITKRDLNISGVESSLSIEFTFKITYEPDMGDILIAGEVLYQTENTKKILDTWKKSKVIEDIMGVEVMNTIFRKCLTRAVSLCDDLRLPPPLTFPLIKPKQ